MGGRITVVVKNNNVLTKMCRWTNGLPYYFSLASLWNGEGKAWLDYYMKDWLLMKEDYEKNKDTGDFEHNMTSIYFPEIGSVPSEYGICVVDFDKKKMYLCQNYKDVSMIYASDLFDRESLKEDDVENFKKLLESGIISKFSITIFDENNKPEISEFSISDFSIEEMCQICLESNSYKLKKFTHPKLAHLNKEEMSISGLCFDNNSDWTVRKEPKTPEGFLMIMNELIDDIGLTINELEGWQDYVPEFAKK